MDMDQLRYDVTLEEVKIINSTITNLDQKMNQIKTWCLTLWTGCWWLLVELTKNHNVNEKYALFIVLIPITFAILDVEVKRNQLKFIYRARILSKWLNNEDLEFKRIKGEDKFRTQFRFYDPSGYGSVHSIYNEAYQEHYEDAISFTTAISESLSIKAFYCILILLSLVGGTIFIVLTSMGIGM